MPFCPNPDCPHRKRLGEPAEFLKGVATCSDCGSPLSETPPLLKPLQKAKKVLVTDFRKRLVLTLLLLAFWNVLRHIGAPGINFEELSKLSPDSARSFPRITIFALGLMPYISAYILVELFALFLPPLKSWRENGYVGRSKLVRAARWLTLILALIQAYYIARGLESMSSVQPVYQPGLSFRLILMVTLVAGTFLTIWFADMISTWGIGHGISVLIFAGYANGLPRRLEKIIALYDGTNPLRHFLGVIIIILVLVAIIVLIERAHQRISVKFEDGFEDGREAYIPIKLTTAGIIPADWARDIMLYPATLTGFVGSQYTFFRQLAIDVSPGKPGYFVGFIFFIILFYYFFSLFFHRPKSIIQFLKNKNAQIIDPPFEDDAKNIRFRRNTMALAGSLYLCLFALLLDISFQISEAPLDGLAFILMVAIALDLIGEIRIRRYSGRLIKVAEFQKPIEAGLLRSLLKQYKIPCQLRGYYHRALLYFFGPYIEISVFVPEEKRTEANNVIAKYLKLS